MTRQFLVILLFGLLVFSGNASAYEDVTPTVAYDMVTCPETMGEDCPGAIILDVRTLSEWIWVGHPGENKLDEGADLEGYVMNIAYKVHHKGKSKADQLIVNNRFVKDVEKLIAKDVQIITLCRSGGRSVEAALVLEAAGFEFVYNMVTGFEGGKDASGYRTLSGWKVDGLPYNFSKDGVYKY